MKPATIATLFLFAGLGQAWRFRGYQNRDYGGTETTEAGPGNAGSACHSVSPLNNEISSFKWYNDGGCTLILYKGIDCKDTIFGIYNEDISVPDLAGTGFNDGISSYETICT